VILSALMWPTRPAVHVDEVLQLEAAQVARDQLTDGADLGGEFLVACGESDFNARSGVRAFALRQPD
jgi:hypothetical protein